MVYRTLLLRYLVQHSLSFYTIQLTVPTLASTWQHLLFQEYDVCLSCDGIHERLSETSQQFGGRENIHWINRGQFLLTFKTRLPMHKLSIDLASLKFLPVKTYQHESVEIFTNLLSLSRKMLALLSSILLANLDKLGILRRSHKPVTRLRVHGWHDAVAI